MATTSKQEGQKGGGANGTDGADFKGTTVYIVLLVY